MTVLRVAVDQPGRHDDAALDAPVVGGDAEGGLLAAGGIAVDHRVERVPVVRRLDRLELVPGEGVVAADEHGELVLADGAPVARHVDARRPAIAGPVQRDSRPRCASLALQADKAAIRGGADPGGSRQLLVGGGGPRQWNGRSRSGGELGLSDDGAIRRRAGVQRRRVAGASERRCAQGSPGGQDANCRGQDEEPRSVLSH